MPWYFEESGVWYCSTICFIITSQVTTLAGSTTGFVDGLAISAQLYRPLSLASDAGGNVFVADSYNFRIRRIDWVSKILSTVAGNGNSAELDGVGTATKFNVPSGLVIFNGTIWVTDYNGCSIRHIGMILKRVVLYFEDGGVVL